MHQLPQRCKDPLEEQYKLSLVIVFPRQGVQQN